MQRLAVRNGVLVSLLPTVRVEQADVICEEGRIVAVGEGIAAGEPDAIDADGAMVLPGLVNAHTHLYSALAAGMPGPAVAPTNFVEILERIWWRLDRALDGESLSLSAFVGGLEAARSGVTTVFDHHASPNFIDGSLGVIAEALDQVGIRGVLCYEVTDRGGPERRDGGIRENASFARAFEAQDWAGVGRSFRGMIGGHASFTLSDETLARLGALCAATNRGFHIHVAEDGADLGAGDPIARYLANGLLGPGAIIAHAVHLDSDALERAQASGAWLVHNPRSNMNNHVGYARLAAASQAAGNARIAVGTDGIGSDVLTEVRTAFLKARDEGLDGAWDLPVALLQGALLLAEQELGQPMGRFEPGAISDLVLTDYLSATPLTTENFAGHLLFGFDRGNIAQVWVGERRIWPTHLNAKALYADARRAAAALWERMEELDG